MSQLMPLLIVRESMPRRRSYAYYSSYSGYGYGREKRRSVPNPLPYLIIALLAGAGLLYFRYLSPKPLSLHGTVVNAYTNAPMRGITVTLQSDIAARGTPTGTVLPAVAYTETTEADGSFLFARVPTNPVVYASADGFAPEKVSAEGKADVNIKLVPNVLRGTVTGKDGKPVAGALVLAGGSHTRTAQDGSYTLKDLPAERRLIVKASGYLSNTVTFGQVVTQNVTLEPFVAKAIYLSADTIATPSKYQSLLSLIDKTELNAVVIDVKADNSGLVLYDSRLPIVQQMKTSNPIISDLDGLLADLRSRNIYTIARLSVFWDQAATAARPDWALKSKKSPGQPWLDALGKRWANPYNSQVWDYNIAIAAEVAQRGFNEVQFDIAYFPSVGDLGDIDYGAAASGLKRVDAIGFFLDHAYDALSQYGAYVSVDVLGLTPYVQDDMGVGQHFEDIAARTDYVSPFVYPSDFPDGFLELDKPAEHPQDLVGQTLKNCIRRASGGIAKIRPWLQDFSRSTQYDAPKVRQEIDGAEQNGATGWMLWNFGNQYTAAALKGP